MAYSIAVLLLSLIKCRLMSCYKFTFIYTAAVYNNNYLKVFHIQRFHRDVMILYEQMLGNREEDELPLTGRDLRQNHTRRASAI